MQHALVLGHATSTVKHESLEQKKLLIAQPLAENTRRPDGPPLLVVDSIGAGAGEYVLLTSDGASVRDQFGVENSPIRWTVLGIVDSKLISPSNESQ